MRTHVLAAAATTAALLALTACSTDADVKKQTPPATASPTPDNAPAEEENRGTSDDVAALKKAVAAYTAAYYEPDVDGVYAMVSSRCQKTWTKAFFAELVERARVGNGGHERYTLERFSVERISGSSAVVTHGVGDEPRYDLTQEWVREADGWRYDDCPPEAS